MLSQEIHFLASEIMPHHLNVSTTKFCQSISPTHFAPLMGYE